MIAAPVSDEMLLFLNEKKYNIINRQHVKEWSDLPFHQIVGIITSNALILDGKTIGQFPHLRWIARVGSGMEIIDTDYCKQHQILYFSSPQGIAHAVAEHAMGMLLSLLHNICIAHQQVTTQHIWQREPNRGQELAGKVVGLIGYGHTGKAFAKKISSLDVQTIAYDTNQQIISDKYAEMVSLPYLQQHADIISFHVPLQADTMNYYNEQFMAQCLKPHYLINTSRGEIIKADVLLKGLQQNRILGAALDVWENEKDIQQILSQPQHILHQILQYPVIITPHIAGYSFQAIEKMSSELILQLKTIE